MIFFWLTVVTGWTPLSFPQTEEGIVSKKRDRKCVNRCISPNQGSLSHLTDVSMGPRENCSSKVSKFFSTLHNDVEIITVSKPDRFYDKV